MHLPLWLLIAGGIALALVSWWLFWPERELYRQIRESAGRPAALIAIGLLVIVYALFHLRALR